LGRKAKEKGVKGIKGKEGIKKVKELFLCLLLNLKNHGEITEASMYRGGDFSTIELKTKDDTYIVNIRKENEKENKNA
jgi:hypothetical protein